jgi:hypothetical protein
VVEEDLVFTWGHYFLLIVFVAIGTMISFFFFKGILVGFGPLQVDYICILYVYIVSKNMCSHFFLHQNVFYIKCIVVFKQIT